MLRCIYAGTRTRQQIADQLKVDKSGLVAVLHSLLNKDIIEQLRKNRTYYYQPAKTQHAYFLQKLLILEPGAKYENFLYGLNFRILSFCLFSWKSIKSIADQLGICPKTVLNRSLYLRYRQLLNRKNHLLKFNQKSWPVLYEFLIAWRNYNKSNNPVLWQFEEEVLYETTPEHISGKLTGFAAYQDSGIPVNVIKCACYHPDRKLLPEEVFIHSLLQIRNDTRLLELAAIFFRKCSLNRAKLDELAAKYDCQEKLKEFFSIMEMKEGKATSHTLPVISVRGIHEMMKTYGMKAT